MPKLFLLKLARPTLRTWAEVVKENFQEIRAAPKILSYSTVCKECKVFRQSFPLKPERWSYERRKKKSHVYKFDRNFTFEPHLDVLKSHVCSLCQIFCAKMIQPLFYQNMIRRWNADQFYHSWSKYVLTIHHRRQWLLRTPWTSLLRKQYGRLITKPCKIPMCLWTTTNHRSILSILVKCMI